LLFSRPGLAKRCGATLGYARRGKAKQGFYCLALLVLSRLCMAWLGWARRGKAKQSKGIIVWPYWFLHGRVWLGYARRSGAKQSKGFISERRIVMLQIKGTITGIAPILFNRMLEGELEPDLGKSSAKGRVSVEDRIEEAKERCYKNEKGLYLPGWNFKVCLLEGVKRSGLKVGRGSLMPYMQASLFPDEKLYFIGKAGPDFIHTTWGRRPPRTGGACMVRRPALTEGWQLAFHLNLMDDRRRPEEVQRSLEEAGLLVGLGSWRPEFGRFIITEWEIQNGSK
jgi:hypothetical protein